MLLIIDNYDSFTHNLAHYFKELNCEVNVIRNDELTIEEVIYLNPAYLVISPGPCTPNEAGISLQLIEQLAGKIPILGICLGHQAIAQVFGGKVMRANNIIHGKTSLIYHQQQGILKNLKNPFRATRYHSLIVDTANLPACLEVTAWTEEQEIMGLRHRTLPIEGVQFHPEAILSECGHQLLNNFLCLPSKQLSKN